MAFLWYMTHTLHALTSLAGLIRFFSVVGLNSRGQSCLVSLHLLPLEGATAHVPFVRSVQVATSSGIIHHPSSLKFFFPSSCVISWRCQWPAKNQRFSEVPAGGTNQKLLGCSSALECIELRWPAYARYYTICSVSYTHLTLPTNREV